MHGRQENFLGEVLNRDEIPVYLPGGEAWSDRSPLRRKVVPMSEISPQTPTRGLSTDEAAHLLDSLKAIVWRGDPDSYCFTYVSQAAEDILGYPLADWLDDPAFWAEHIHPDDRDWTLDYCVSNTNALRDHEFEYRMIAADGREVWLKDVVHLVVKDGRPVESVGVMVDISDTKRAEAAEHELESARANQRHALQLNDAVVQGLAVAKYALDLELDQKAEEAVSETLEKAREIVAGLLETAGKQGLDVSQLLRPDATR